MGQFGHFIMPYLMTGKLTLRPRFKPQLDTSWLHCSFCHSQQFILINPTWFFLTEDMVMSLLIFSGHGLELWKRAAGSPHRRPLKDVSDCECDTTSRAADSYASRAVCACSAVTEETEAVLVVLLSFSPVSFSFCVCVFKHSCGLKQTQLDLPDWEPGLVPLLTSNTYTMSRCVFVLYCIYCITSYVYIHIHNKIVYLYEENNIVISSSSMLSLLKCLFMMYSRVAVCVNRFRGSFFRVQADYHFQIAHFYS